MKSIALAVCALLVVALARAQTNCHSPDGTYDLSGLAGADIMAKDTSYNYAVNICGQATKPSTCPSTLAAGSVYQWPISGTGSCHMLSSWDSTATWTPISNTDPSQGVIVQLKNGDLCTNPRQVAFLFACASGDSTTYTVQQQAAPNNCNYNIPMANSYGCPGGGGGGGGGGGKKGLSGGSVFLIIFFVGFFVYVLAGCIYKRTKVGATGMEACPNIDFWRDLPSLIKDGFSFTWRKLRSCCGGGDASYDSMK